jgi:patatin-like phospholipase/acyl hydrolase
VRFLILQARLDPLENAPLKLVCQATAAAPTYLPPVHFKLTNSTTDASREFNLIDGGVAVNNPVTCGFWSFILFYFGFYFGGGLFRAQTDHKFSSGQTNPK